MAELAVDNQGCGELEESQVVVGLLFPAHEQPTEAIEPGMGDFDDPAAWLMAGGVAWGRERVRGAPPARDVREEVLVQGRLPTGWVVVAPVQHQVPIGRREGVLRVRSQGSIEQLRQFLHIRAIGPGDHQADRHPPRRRVGSR